MSLLPFMRQKATEKGIKTCQNCGEQDIFFALNGTCLECNNPIPRNGKEKSLQFSIEIFTEFFEKYDEIFTPEQKKIPLQFLKGLIYSLSKKNILENEKIIKLQSIVKNIGKIGGNAIGGAISMENGKPGLEMLEDFSGTVGDPMSRVKSLSAVILAIQYILDYKVKNEFVLETAIPKPATSATRTNTSQPANNKGCLSSFVLLLTTLSFIVGLIISVL
jgi:hypothetical protein